MRLLISAAFAFGLLMLPSSSEAATLRCGSDLVSDGASRYEVWRKCGQPVSQETRTVFNTVSYVDQFTGAYVQGQVTTVVDEWIYTSGSTNFDQHVIFQDGKLVEVRSGSYGR